MDVALPGDMIQNFFLTVGQFASMYFPHGGKIDYWLNRGVRHLCKFHTLQT